MLKKLALLLMPICLQAQNYQKVHEKAIVVDSHNDILTACIEKKVSLDNDLKGKTHSDLNRFKQGGVSVQIFSVWCDGNQPNPNAWANREMDTLDAVINRNPDKYCKKFCRIETGYKRKKTSRHVWSRRRAHDRK